LSSTPTDRFLARLHPSARAAVEAQAGAVIEDMRKHEPPPSSAPAAAPRARRGQSQTFRRGRAPEPRKREAEEVWAERRIKKLRDQGWAKTDLFLIPRWAWDLGAKCRADRTGRTLWWNLTQCGNRAAVGAIRAAMFGGRRGWHSPFAIKTGTLGLLLTRLAVASGRKSKWRYELNDVARNALCALLYDGATKHTPSLSAISGRHRSDGSLDNGQIGYLQALQQAGLIQRFQVRRCENDPSCNLYRVIGHSAYATDEQLRELAALQEASWLLEEPPSARPPPS
jgi:hypothetical protein